MKKTIFTLLMCSLSNLFLGQTTISEKSIKIDSITKRNTIYLELLGQGGIYSVSGDRLFRIDKRVKTSVSLGVTIFTNFNSNSFFGIPVSYNFLFGKKSSHLELGAGLSAMVSTSNYLQYPKVGLPYYGVVKNYFLSFTPKIGYRYQKQKGGFFFRATFSPLITVFAYTTGSLYDDGIFYFSNDKGFGNSIWAGVSFGFTLKK